MSSSGQSSTERSDSPKDPGEEPEAISFLGALRIPVSCGTRGDRDGGTSKVRAARLINREENKGKNPPSRLL